MGRPGEKPPMNNNPMFYAETTVQPAAYQYNNGIPINQPTIPTVQPTARPMQIGLGNNNFQKWNSDLFDCMNDPNNALITCFFPCVTFGQIAEIVDEGTTPCGTSGLLYGLICFVVGIPCVYSCTFRSKLRNKFGLSEAPAPDWITHCFCEVCALCQEYRELNARGFDPSIGWLGNIQKQQMTAQQPAMMAPPTGQRMMG